MTTSIFWLIVCILYLIYCNYYQIYPIAFFLHISPSLFCHGTAFISYSLRAHLYHLAVFFSLPSANMALLSFSLFLQIDSFQAQRIFNSSHPSAHCFRYSIFLLYSNHRIYSSRYKRFFIHFRFALGFAEEFYGLSFGAWWVNYPYPYILHDFAVINNQSLFLHDFHRLH